MLPILKYKNCNWNDSYTTIGHRPVVLTISILMDTVESIETKVLLH